MNKVLRDIWLLAQRYFLQMVKNPTWLIVGFSTPILYLALFSPLLKTMIDAPHVTTGAVLDLFLPGILAFLAFGSGVGPGFSVVFELKSGMIERLRVTPASRFAILIGPILAALALMFIFDLVLLAVGVWFGFTLHFAGLALLGIPIALLMVTTCAFAVATALATRDINGFAAIMNGINLPIMLLAGVLLPISLGPLWLRVLAHFDPLYYLVTASRALSAGDFGASAVWQSFAVLVPLCALVLAWATSVMRRAVA
ncbi:MAG: ABC transporter permease [Actinomycetia bacterium]|nr:ABC transporter permease [Actinomycetes bacterium]